MTTGSILLLITAMAYATVTDFRWGRIPNQLTFPMIAGGVALRAVTGGADGVGESLAGAGLGLALTVLPFALNWLGAGDVKLAMVVGALMGPAFTFLALLLTAIVGGAIGLAYLIWKRQLLANLLYIFFFWYMPAPRDAATGPRLPYAPVMACGCAIAVASYQLSIVSYQLPAFSLPLLALG